MEELKQIVQQLQIMAENQASVLESVKALREIVQSQQESTERLQTRVFWLEQINKADV